jgi:hypothetical protein
MAHLPKNGSATLLRQLGRTIGYNRPGIFSAATGGRFGGFQQKFPQNFGQIRSLHSSCVVLANQGFVDHKPTIAEAKSMPKNWAE